MITIDQGGAGSDAVLVVPPPAGLAALVEYFWIDGPGLVPSRNWRIVPDDAPHIIFSETTVAGHSRYRLALVGARTVHADLDRSARVQTIGVRLRPGVLPSLIGLPAAALTDRAIPFGDVMHRLAREAIDRLSSEPARASHHLAWLIHTVAAKARPVDARAMWLSARPRLGATRIDDIAAELGLSDRTLRAWSGRTLGLSLKRLLRIRRLHGSLLVHRARPNLTWSQVAALAGYADHAHCARDFRHLLGEAPSRFSARRFAVDCRNVQAAPMAAG